MKKRIKKIVIICMLLLMSAHCVAAEEGFCAEEFILSEDSQMFSEEVFLSEEVKEIEISEELNAEESDFIDDESSLSTASENSQLELASIASGTYGNIEWVLGEDGVLTISGQGEIRNFYFDDGVYDAWNEGKTEDFINTVVFEEGITGVGNYAFYECKNLKTIQFSSTVTSIGHAAFYGTGIEEIIFPENMRRVSQYAFGACKNLKKAVLNENLWSIEIGAFGGSAQCEVIWPGSFCTFFKLVGYSKEKLQIGAPITYLKGTEHKFSSGKIETYATENQYGTIYFECSQCGVHYYLAYLSDGEEAHIQRLTSNNKGFWEEYPCPELFGSTITIPETIDHCPVTAIGGFAGACVKKVVCPDTVKEIKEEAFSECTSLEEIKCSKVEKIGRAAFEDCRNLKSLYAPKLKTIGNEAFARANSMEKIYCPKVQKIGSWAFGARDIKFTGGFEYLTTVEREGLSGCSQIKDFSTFKRLKTIGEAAFASCTGLKSVVLPETVKEIGPEAFRSCTELSEVVLPESLEKIGNRAFADCNNFLEIAISDHVASIGEYALFSYYSRMYSSYKIKKDRIIYGYKGTAAETYATKHKITFQLLPCKNDQHTVVIDKKVKATCTKAGKTQGSHCSTCGVVIIEQKKIKALGHSYGEGVIVLAPTYTKEGSMEYTCTVCNHTKTEILDKLPLLKTPAISKVTNTSTGIKISWDKVEGAVKYRVLRKNSEGKWVKLYDTSLLSYTDKSVVNGNLYLYSVRCVTKDGKTYASSYDKTGTKKVYLAPTEIVSLKNPTEKAMKVTWKKNAAATGYHVKYETGTTSVKVTVSGASVLNKTISKLTQGKTYQVYVRSYKKVDGVTYYSVWTPAKSIKITK